SPRPQNVCRSPGGIRATPDGRLSRRPLPCFHSPFSRRIATVNILIVEDDVPIGQALEAQWPLHGFTVHRAETLAAAMERAEERSFQAMILDLRLPDGDGLELLKEVRQRRPPLPTIITTARD